MKVLGRIGGDELVVFASDIGSRETYPELFLAADKAMYAAKQNGRRQLSFYEDI